MSMNDDELSSGWEKCARAISLNTRAEIFDLLNLLQTICLNIISYPEDSKYRIIKLNNATIQSRLLGRQGGEEFLSAIGFKTVVVDTIRTLQLDIDNAVSSSKLVDIDESLTWLSSTVDTCIKGAEDDDRPLEESCAQCTIKLKLPTGLSVAGGFARTDLVNSILSFACCYFRPEKYGSVQLRLNTSPLALNAEDLEKTLLELGLCPRAVLLVSVQSDDDRAGSMMQARVKVSADIKNQKEKAEKIRNDKLKARKQLEVEKARTLAAFEGDRTAVKDRRSIPIAAAAPQNATQNASQKLLK